VQVFFLMNRRAIKLAVSLKIEIDHASSNQKRQL
jgi:hypothetical protein